MKQKPEPKSVGPLKDEDFVPWNGVTLNRCLAIAAIAALLSVGFQILQGRTVYYVFQWWHRTVKDAA